MMTDQNDFLEQCRERYEGGDKLYLLYCLNYCMMNNRPIPPWLATAFRQAYDKVDMYEVKSWDDVFGRPLKKGKRLATEHRNMKIVHPLFLMIRDRHEAGAAINKELFNEVGAEFGVSGTVASELYYKLLKEMTMDH
jgi:hypothetical protein